LNVFGTNLKWLRQPTEAVKLRDLAAVYRKIARTISLPAKIQITAASAM
jgi:hypothetical protein